ncbi:hypothetical protein N657DRAFT_280586 [Parathielavia appendiculata]|uniref:Uncharacterized protein n=1 Tax=Parathielavia appendiculata TaxID=2587402 RepID=A0AAN6U4T7_9PEZI|nr:hypothetical protein N657DRAFT_280586 [Parathielavia appendiculata]
MERNNWRSKGLPDVQHVGDRTQGDWVTVGALSQSLKITQPNGNVQAECDSWLASWDFTLPRVPAFLSLDSIFSISKGQQLGINGTSVSALQMRPSSAHVGTGFSLCPLIGAIQEEESCDIVRAYLTYFAEILGSDTPKTRLNDRLDGCPGIFFVVDTGNLEMLKLWTSYAGNADQTYRKIPVLGFAIAHCQEFRQDMPLVVKNHVEFRMASGCDSPRLHDLDDLDDARVWCLAAPARKRIAQALNLRFTVRYVFHSASRDERLSGANRKLAEVHRASELLGIRYFLVVQTLASGHLTERFLTYLAMPTPQPLVLPFAAPSGHGKTELAGNLGRLLSLGLHGVNCTSFRLESSLFCQ